MYLLVLFLLLIAGVILFFKRDMLSSIAIFLFFLTDGYQLMPESLLADSPINKYADFALLYILIICAISGIRRKSFFAASDPLTKFIYLMLGFMLVQLIITVGLGLETFAYSFKVFRQFLFLLSYFVLRTLSVRDISRIIRYSFYLTLFIGILYVMQVVLNMQILAGKVDDLGSITSEKARFRNLPLFTDFFLFFLIFTKVFKKWRVPALILLVICFILPMNRGPIFAIGLVFCIYYLKEGKVKNLVKYALILTTVFLIAWPFIADRFTKTGSGSDISRALSLRGSEGYDENEGGTFDFRIALFLERGEYIFSHPQQLLFGVGMRHDDSPFTERDFRFFIGTMKVQDGNTIKQQLDTPDLVWAPIIIRFGLVGMALYIMFYITLMRFFYKNRENKLALIALLLIGMYIILSFATDILVRPITFYIITLCYVAVNKSKQESINSPLPS